MKKEMKIIIAVVLAVWFFVMGFELGVYKEKKAHSTISVTPITTQPTQTTQPTLPPTQPPVTEAPTEPSTQASADNTTTQKQEDSTAADKDHTNLSKDEIIAEVNKYVNQVKKEKNMTASSSSTVAINVTDCSAQALLGTINTVISGITEKFNGQETFTFVNGQATDEDGNAVTPWDVIPPTGKDFLALGAGVASATVEKVDANTRYTIVMVSEDTTMASPVPTYNSTVIGYLDLVSLDLPFNLTQADMHYPGSTISVLVNPDGKVIELINKLPMEGTGATKFIGKDAYASFAGALDEMWVFNY